MNGYTIIAEKLEKNEPLDENERKLAILCVKFMQRCRYENVPDCPFISGEAGQKRDGDHMPEYFFICPTYGVDFSVLYKRVDKE